MPRPPRFRARRPVANLLAQGTAGGPQHELLVLPLGQRIGDEREAADIADRVPFDDHLAAPGHGGKPFLAFGSLQPAHQMRRAPVDEAGGQPLVERIGEQVFGLPGALLPV